MYSKDKSVTIHFRLSRSEYNKLISSYNAFLQATNYANVTFSEFIRRLLLGAKIDLC